MPASRRLRHIFPGCRAAWMLSAARFSTVDLAVRSSVEKLDIGALSTTCVAAVRRGCPEGRPDTGRRRAACAVLHMVAHPQSTRHEHLISMLAGLPAQVATMCARASADVDAETRSGLSEKVAELRVRMDEAHSREVLDTKASVGVVAQRVQNALPWTGLRRWGRTQGSACRSRPLCSTPSNSS